MPTPEIESGEKKDKPEKELSGLAKSAIEDAKNKNDYSFFRQIRDVAPEMKGKSIAAQIDFLVENGIDPTRVYVQSAGPHPDDTPERLSSSYQIEAMARTPEMAAVLYNHLYMKDLELSAEQRGIAILGVIEHGDRTLVEGLNNHHILTSSSLDESYRSKVSQALRSSGYEDMANKFEEYYR